MFTGIITGLGTVREITPLAGGQDMRLVIATPWADTEAIPAGASVACSGCCLTVTARGPDWFAADVSAETLAKTTLGLWHVGSPVNLERALRLGDELGGHLVSGHVDGVAETVLATPEHGSLRLRFQLPAPLARFVAQKGSVAVDGVSLTVNEVSGNEVSGNEVSAPLFGVNIIPHTAGATTLGALAPGDKVNIEIDTLARYVARLAEQR